MERLKRRQDKFGIDNTEGVKLLERRNLMHQARRSGLKTWKKCFKRPTCVECYRASPPYKCPVCLKNYCSVVCCKKHKLRCSSAASIEPTVSAPSRTSFKNGIGKLNKVRRFDFPTEDTLSPDTLQQIKNDERILTLLKSSNLRTKIRLLDETQHSSYSFRDIMKDPEFYAFSNVALEIAGIKSDYNIDD